MNQKNIAEIIARMQQPDFYPHLVTEPIQLMQTHVSYVLLTGDYAYKLKKPVNFGFLNYSTLEKRKHFCEEEIRLNQEMAAEIYVEVLPIKQANNEINLGGEGEAVEYTLKMRQFPQEALLSEQYKQGLLSIEQIEELGHVVADFHGNTTTNDYIQSFGEIAQIQPAFTENYQQTEKYVGTAQTQAQLEETQAFTNRFFAERAELFALRQKEGKIRECHGDLHLGNVCLWNGKVLLFDRIEFNEPFRFVDVIYDLAFVVMDLDARGSRDFGNTFLNTYIEQTGDWEGLQLLPLYLSRQAYVRAKVTSFLLDDPGIPEKDKEEARINAANYYRLAWEYTQTTQGQLILMSGLSGSGKTTVAKEMAREVGAVHLRSDAVRKHLAGIPVTEKGDDSLYTKEMNQKTYSRLLELGSMLAGQGFKVILDAKYDRQEFRGQVLAKAQVEGIPLQIMHCTAPMEVLRDRVSNRSGDISDATPELLAPQQAQAEEFTTTEKAHVTDIDTTQPWQSQVQLTR